MESDAFRLEYDFPATAQRVWDHLTDANLLDSWFWPASLEGRFVTEPRPLGGFRFASEPAGMAVSGRYVEFGPPERLVMTWRWDDGDESTRVVVSLSESAGGGTKLNLVHSGHENQSALENHRTGWTHCLDRLRSALAE